jgi:DNA modification methylase
LKPLLSQFLTDTDFVFDPFVGSGALLKAAQTLHKNNVFGIEIVEEWAAKANDLLH